jgi:hypothetical protein
MSNKKLVIAVLVLVVLVGGYAVLAGVANAPTVEEGALNAGTSAYVNASQDIILVASPQPGESVGQTFSIKGSARGYWYFEASFPIEVRDSNGNVIGQAIAQADGDWMTEDFVPFTAPVELSAPYSGQAIVMLKKDNPSGEPENDASVSFPVVIQ